MSEIKRFLIFLHDEVVLTYHVSTMTYREYQKHHLQSRKEFAARWKITEQELDKRLFMFGDGHPDNKNSTIFAAIPQGEIARICSKNGYLASELGKMLIAILYEGWNEHYQKAIAKELGYERTNNLELDIFGDLKNIRNAILHEEGIADKKVENNKILRWFSKGEKISIDNKRFQEMIENIIEEMYKLALHAGMTEKISPIPTFWVKTIFDPNYHKNQ